MANPALRDSWEHRPSLVEYLAQQVNRGSLALLLGAGISMEYGIPDWAALIDNLWAAKRCPNPESDLLRSAERFRLQFHRDNMAGFLEDVSAALYRDFAIDFGSLLGNPTLSAIGALVMSSHRGNVSKVVSFNYDDVLELYLEYHGFNTVSLWDPKHWSTSVDVTVYHPHGFLPSRPDVERSEEIILDQRSYSSVVGDVTNLWHQQLVTLMRTHTLLLVGLSVTDLNLDSLLFKSKNNHALLKTPEPQRPLFSAVRLTTDDDPGRRTLFEERGIYTETIRNYHKELPQFLFAICQRAAQLRGA
jgi:hypothetical protein